MSCPRCGGGVRPPDLMRSEWRCDVHGAVLPFHVAKHIDGDIVDAARTQVRVPLWCPWPLLPRWMVTGVAWVGDDRTRGRAAAVACSGPAPLGGPADLLLVSEEPGVGLGPRFAGIDAPDLGQLVRQRMAATAPDAKVRAAGHPTPMWAVNTRDDRSVYVGEAKGVWLYAVAWPASAGYVLAEHVTLCDLVASVPNELVYGAPSPYLHGLA
ncbi:MAG: DUF6758 family protein [Micromonosporaceae bacterium]